MTVKFLTRAIFLPKAAVYGWAMLFTIRYLKEAKV
jgi:hypothetical protein